jgi:hypothetical protein
MCVVRIRIGVEGRSNGSTRDIRSRLKKAGWMVQGKEIFFLMVWGSFGEEARDITRGGRRALNVGCQSQNPNLLPGGTQNKEYETGLNLAMWKKGLQT